MNRILKNTMKLKGAKFLAFLLLLAVLAPLIANEKALVMVHQGELSFPFLQNKPLEPQSIDFVLSAPIPYSSNGIDYKNMNSTSPFDQQNVPSLRYRHWLGTDELGRDVLAGIIEGSQTAVFIGFGSMILAFLLALTLGGSAGYFGNKDLKLPLSKLLSFSFAGILALIYVLACFPFEVNHSTKDALTTLGIGLLLFFLLYALLRTLLPKKLPLRSLAIDNLVLSLIELLDSIPVLFLLIALSAILEPSATSLILIIASVAWTGMARHIRAQVLRIKQRSFVESGKSMGFTPLRLVTKHIFPNAMAPVFISLSFGIASAILFESTLSFLGLGLGADQVSWGSLLAEARSDYQSWWLALFPGMMLFLSLMSLNRLGDQLSR